MRWWGFWSTGGWLVLGLIALLSLLPMPQMAQVDVPGADKFEHLLAYFLVCFWHSQLRLTPTQLMRRAVAIVAFSGLIEVLQEQTGYRSGDFNDLIANSIGVIFGVVIGLARPDWLQRVEARIEQHAVQRGWIVARLQEPS